MLVNLWASWCAPCIKELPTLEQLEQAQAEDGKLGVIAVSQDMAPQGSVDAFLGEREHRPLRRLPRSQMALSAALGVQVMPTTMLYDAQGRKCGATSATSTGPAPRRLSCWPRR